MMAVQDSLESALRALNANKLRAGLTTLGIIIGVSAVIAVVSLIQGLQSNVLRQVERVGSQTIFIRPILPGDVPLDEFLSIQNKDLTLDDMKALVHAVPQVTLVTPIFFTSIDLKADGRSTSTNVLMTDDTYLEQNRINLAQGRNFVPSDIRLGSKVVIIGPRIIEKLALKGNPIGHILSTPTLSLEVIGVLEEQGAQLGNDPDQNILIPLTTGLAQLTEMQRRQLFIQARIDPRFSPEDGTTLVEDALRRIKGLRSKVISGFRVFSPRQITGIVTSITGTITNVAVSIVSIALLVGGIGIMNIMLVAVTERTREIGLRKAVGARRQEILLQFLIEAVLICFLGGALGVGLGFAVGAIAGKALFGAMGTVPVWAILSAFLVPVLIGILFGLYPAAKASKLDPIDALRFE